MPFLCPTGPLHPYRPEFGGVSTFLILLSPLVTLPPSATSASGDHYSVLGIHYKLHHSLACILRQLFGDLSPDEQWAP